MAQVFSFQASQALTALLGIFLAGIIIAPALWLTADRSSFATGQFQPLDQPIAFSHAHHVGEVGLDCRYCHQGVEVSGSAGLPATQICMTCHSQILTDAPMLAPLRESLAARTPIVWARVHDLPDFVYFNHSVHVNNGVGCETCHGRIDQMPVVEQVEPLTMQWCVGCHRDPAPNLRPREAIFEMGWHPPSADPRYGQGLAVQYGIDPRTLTDCYVCHR